MNDGLLIVLSGPSGSGKDSVLKMLVRRNENIRLSVSATTRPPRDYEEHGRDYYFVSKEEFLYMTEQGEVFEYAEYCGNYYGTPKKPVFDWMSKRLDVIFEIEVNGAMQVKDSHPEVISIFIMPPSIDELEKRLRSRGSDSDESILKRLDTAKVEMKAAVVYDYVVINDVIEDAVASIEAILSAEKHKSKFMNEFIEGVVVHD